MQKTTKRKRDDTKESSHTNSNNISTKTKKRHVVSTTMFKTPLPSEMYALIISFASHRFTQAVTFLLVSKEWQALTFKHTVGLMFEAE